MNKAFAAFSKILFFGLMTTWSITEPGTRTITFLTMHVLWSLRGRCCSVCQRLNEDLFYLRTWRANFFNAMDFYVSVLRIIRSSFVTGFLTPCILGALRKSGAMRAYAHWQS